MPATRRRNRTPPVNRIDALFAWASRSLRPTLQILGDLEYRAGADRLEACEIRMPVFLCGLPRSGSTILLECLARAPEVATNRYRDFPFPWIPLTWSRFQDRFGHSRPPAERILGDGIEITRESPEAMEEPLWETVLPNLHHPRRGHVLDPELASPELERALQQHMRKILWLRGGSRYVSKGHYNSTRIAWLAHRFPDARFIVPVRHPAVQVASLAATHQRLLDEADANGRIGNMLRAAGHYEFGPHRAPVNVQPYGAGIDEPADTGAAGFYAGQWAAVYHHLWTVAAQPALGDRILFVRHEALCARPANILEAVFEFCRLAPAADAFRSIRDPQRRVPDEYVETAWEKCADTARLLGYDKMPG